MRQFVSMEEWHFRRFASETYIFSPFHRKHSDFGSSGPIERMLLFTSDAYLAYTREGIRANIWNLLGGLTSFIQTSPIMVRMHFIQFLVSIGN